MIYIFMYRVDIVVLTQVQSYGRFGSTKRYFGRCRLVDVTNNCFEILQQETVDATIEGSSGSGG